MLARLFRQRTKEGSLDPEGIQAWFEWEEEAFRYDVDPDISRDDLATLIEGPTVMLPPGSSTTRPSGRASGSSAPTTSPGVGCG